MGREFDPEFFDLHELQNRVDDFQRVIGEARWGSTTDKESARYEY